ncbi:SLAP domain-containing protein [Massilibacterium senegalense]|uniref:SLAP domain-containing protein n=1 Tax=Massilibacterium senegalense TaxID=1632858 RepID=UPI0007862B04|nr:SLAP domain-containing protein [Massilibacterium senegalense]
MLPFTRLTITPQPVSTNNEMMLSIHPSWNLSTEDTYVYRFLNRHLPPVSGIELAEMNLKQTERGIYTTVFIRNGTSKSLSLQEETLVLYRGSDRVAREKFNFQTIGELPPFSNRPWTFFFRKEILLLDVPMNDKNWTLSFESRDEDFSLSLDLENSWQHSMSASGLKRLLKLIDTLKKPKQGTLSFEGLQFYEKNGAMVLLFLIRNATDKDYFLSTIRCTVIDDDKRPIAVGTFDLGSLRIHPKTSKPWSLIFSNEQILTKIFNPFKKWSISITLNSD